MMRCNNCGYRFEEPVPVREAHGEEIWVCPECRVADLDWSEADEEPE